MAYQSCAHGYTFTYMATSLSNAKKICKYTAPFENISMHGNHSTLVYVQVDEKDEKYSNEYMYVQ